MSENKHVVWGWILNQFDSALSEFHPKKFFPVFHFNLKTAKPILFQKNTNLFFILWDFSSVATLEKQLSRCS